MLKEQIYGYSIIGTHRDNYNFIINDISFFKYASFGQTRLAALVLKLIQAEFYKKKFDFYPILLLDDVILELDKEREKKILKNIIDYKQIFLTVTDKKYTYYFNNINLINEIEIFNGKAK